MQEELDLISRKYRLEIIKIYADKHDRIVALVLNEQGDKRLLKITASAYRNAREQALCQAWQEVGVSPAGELLEDGVLIREWIDAPLVSETISPMALSFEAGRVLALAHGAATDFDFPLMSEFLAARLTNQLSNSPLSPARKSFIEKAASQTILLTDDGCLAHGDAASVNAFFVPNLGIQLIDGRGHRGGSSLDLADWVIRLEGENPLESIRELIKGYGVPPPGLAHQLAWLLVTDGIDSPRSDIQPLIAEELLSKGVGSIKDLADYWL